MTPLRPRSLLAALTAGLALCACSQGGAQSDDPYAGVDAEIRAWRESLEASHPLCAAKVEGKGCESFEVACKGAREVTPDETAAGLTAKLVAAMVFQGRAEDGSTSPGSAFATFTRTGEAWKRGEAEAVNLQTCAAF